MTAIEMLRADCPHTGARWEVNPRTRIRTRRCSRCGEILAVVHPRPAVES